MQCNYCLLLLLLLLLSLASAARPLPLIHHSIHAPQLDRIGYGAHPGDTVLVPPQGQQEQGQGGEGARCDLRL